MPVWLKQYLQIIVKSAYFLQIKYYHGNRVKYQNVAELVW